MSNTRVILGSFALVLVAATSVAVAAPDTPAPISAQSTPVSVSPAPASSAPNYGTSLLTYEQVPAAAFTPFVSGTAYSLTQVNTGQALRTTGAPQYFGAAVRIPSGALLKYLELDACDNTGATGYVQASIIESDRLGNITTAAQFILTDGTGCKFFSEDLTALNMVADNLTKRYWLAAYVSVADGFNVGLAGMVVGYQLQVSPAPAVATFGDVPTNDPFFRYIEALAASGITGGCGNGNYCPGTPVTRGQMAVFLAKALGLQFQ